MKQEFKYLVWIRIRIIHHRLYWRFYGHTTTLHCTLYTVHCTVVGSCASEVFLSNFTPRPPVVQLEVLKVRTLEKAHEMIYEWTKFPRSLQESLCKISSWANNLPTIFSFFIAILSRTLKFHSDKQRVDNGTKPLHPIDK